MKILEPIKVGKTYLKNRLMFPPLTTGYEGRDGSITPRSKYFYSRLAKGGTGYIVIGDVNPVASFSPTPRLCEDGQIDSFKELVEEIHSHGAKVGAQIFYPEYDVEALNIMAAQGKMGEIRAKLHYDMEHFTDEVTKSQLLEILEKMVNCAIRAEKAGFDAIQIHGDRLLGTLCGSKMNHRTDEFGGCLENRVRFARMVAQAMRKAVPNLILEYKLSIITPERGRGGIDFADACTFAKWLQEDGVDMLHVAQANHTGNLADTIPPMGVQSYGFFVDYASAIKKAVDIPVSCVGRIIDPQMAENILWKEKSDIIAIGRPLLCDPDWIVKLEDGKPESIGRCISCNKGCTDAIQNRSSVGCILNAETGFEQRSIVLTDKPKKIAIIGGGPAGLEAGRVASLRGHEVTLWEKELSLGGQLNIASVPPRKDEMQRAIIDKAKAIMDTKVIMKLGEEANIKTIIDENFDTVIVAVGSNSVIPKISGFDGANVCDARKVLSGETSVYGKIVVIGGGLVGCETAEYVASKGSQVVIVEMLENIATGESVTVLPTMMDSFENHGVIYHTKTAVTEITRDSVICSKEDKSWAIDCDFVIMAVGARPAIFDTNPLKEAGIDVKFIGDCGEGPNDIGNAISQGYDIACEI